MAKRQAHLPKGARAPGPLKLDLGSGPNKKPGFLGVDRLNFPGVDHVLDLADPSRFWPWKDNTVDEIYCSHLIEHFDPLERMHFINEIYRILKPGTGADGPKCTLICPDWSSGRAYGDPTHKWPPMAGFSFYYYSRDWRKQNAPHTDIEWNPAGLCCDFTVTWVYSVHPAVMARNQEYQQHALTFFKEAAQDIIATLIKVPHL